MSLNKTKHLLSIASDLLAYAAEAAKEAKNGDEWEDRIQELLNTATKIQVEMKDE